MRDAFDGQHEQLTVWTGSMWTKWSDRSFLGEGRLS